MIEALVFSVGEPQLERCLESVKNQILPFSGVVHINDVSPESEAFNQGFKQITEEWVMKIDGDVILNENAVSAITSIIKEGDFERVGQYQFGLYDTFVHQIIEACCVYRVEALRSVEWRDSLDNDRAAKVRIERNGWVVRSSIRGENGFVVGTHFDEPNEFQIFRRFFVRGVRGNYGVLRLMKRLYEKTKDQNFALAIKAIEYGFANPNYPGSHNINFDRKAYERFKEGVN